MFGHFLDPHDTSGADVYRLPTQGFTSIRIKTGDCLGGFLGGPSSVGGGASMSILRQPVRSSAVTDVEDVLKSKTTTSWIACFNTFAGTRDLFAIRLFGDR